MPPRKTKVPTVNPAPQGVGFPCPEGYGPNPLLEHDFGAIATKYDLKTIPGRLAFWAEIRGSAQRNLTTMVVLTYANALFIENTSEIRHTNRGRSPKDVNKYARIIKRGAWKPTAGIPFAYDENGQLLNGFTRTLAVLKTRLPIIIKMEGPLTSDAAELVDVVSSRTVEQQIGCNWDIPAEQKPAVFTKALNIIKSYLLRGHTVQSYDPVEELKPLAGPLLRPYLELMKTFQRRSAAQQVWREPALLGAVIYMMHYATVVERRADILDIWTTLRDNNNLVPNSALHRLHTEITAFPARLKGAQKKRMDSTHAERLARLRMDLFTHTLHAFHHQRSFGSHPLTRWNLSAANHFDDPILCTQFLTPYKNIAP